MVTKNYTPINYLINTLKPVSFPKEAEPMIKSGEKNTIQEVVEHESKDHPKIIQIHPETIKLPPDLKKLGLQLVSNNQFYSLKNVVIPIRDDRVLVGLHAPITSSFRWLATLAVYILSHAHITLKSVKGKTVRIFKK